MPLASLKNEDILSSKKDISVSADASIDLPDSSIVDTSEKGIDNSEKKKKEKKHRLKVKSLSLQKNWKTGQICFIIAEFTTSNKKLINGKEVEKDLTVIELNNRPLRQKSNPWYKSF